MGVSREMGVWFPSRPGNPILSQVPTRGVSKSLLSGSVDRATRLALAARDGNREALASFVNSTYEPVWRYAAAVAGRSHADDIAQETFERAMQSLPRYRGDAPVTTWLIGIARHVHLAGIRRNDARSRVHNSAMTRADAIAFDSAARVELADVIARLDDDRRDAFVLTQVMGFRYDEAAAICGCPTGTIRSRVARARAELMALLDDKPHSLANDPN
jgi:RNA polymerase sigma-70 factor (ECF subfamily)